MRQWIKQASDLNRIAKTAEPRAIKDAFAEIEGLNLFLKSKKAQPTAAPEISPPLKNIWFALCATKEKTAQRAAHSDFLPILVSLYDKARTYFEENCWKLQGGGQRPPRQKNNSLHFLNFTPAEFLFLNLEKNCFSGRCGRHRRQRSVSVIISLWLISLV